MPEEITTTTTAGELPATTTTATQTADEPLGENGKKALDAERKAREAADGEVKRLQKLVDDKATADRKAEEAKAQEQGEWEKLAKQREDELNAARAELAKRDHNALKAKAAAKHRLPDELAERLAGETEADLDADAAKLAKLVEPRKAPDTEAGSGTKGATPSPDRPQPKVIKEPTYTYDRSAQKVPWPS